MNNFALTLKAIFTGLFTGLLVAIPLGPAGLESVKRTISKGYREGFLLALGAITADAFDILLLNFGLFDFLSGNKKTEAIFWIVSGAVLIVVGYLSIRGNEKIKELETRPHLLDNKKIYSVPFITGFLMVLVNPLTHSLWITMSGTIIRVWHSAGVVPYYAFLISIISGMVIWFAFINFLALKGNEMISNKSSKKISDGMMWLMLALGVGFVLFGIYYFVK